MAQANDIREIVRRAYEDGRTGDSAREIMFSEIRQYLAQRSKESAKEIDRAAREAVRTYARERDEQVEKSFAKTYGANARQVAELQKSLKAEVSRASQEVDRVASAKAMQNMQRQLVRSRRDGSSPEREQIRLIRAARNFERGLQAEVSTARAGLDQLARNQAARAAGREFFRYVGPGGGRNFCGARLGGIFHITEIRAMTNGQGLPVEVYCGGYHCRHRWASERDKLPDAALDLIRDFDRQLRGNDAFELLMGHTLDGRRLGKAFNFENPGFKVQLTALDADEVDSAVTINAVVRNVAGEKIGTVERRFHYDNGQLEAKHSLLSLDKPYQGRGATTAFMRNAVELYDELGIDTVRVHAALSGGHLQWAKFGFDFDDQHSRQKFVARFAKYISDEAGVDFDEVRQEVDNLDMPIDFIRYDKEHNGRRIKGADWKKDDKFDWYGRLDLNKAGRSRRIFDAYTKKK